jgi:RND family efflux transporter MFP subunit
VTNWAFQNDTLRATFLASIAAWKRSNDECGRSLMNDARNWHELLLSGPQPVNAMPLPQLSLSACRLGPLLAASLACALLLNGCTSGASAPSPPAPTVQVVSVVQQDTPIYSEWVATLDGYVNAQIQPRVAGYVIKQNYKEGSVVRKGEVLFEIDPRPFKAALDQAKAQLAQAEAQLGKASLDVQRDTPLAQARAIAQSQLDTEIQAKLGAQATVLAAKANVEQAELNVEFTKVTSLVTGIAGIALVQIGGLVGPSSVLTSVSQVDPIKAYFTVSEQEFTDFHRRFPTEKSVEEQRRRMPLQLLLADGTVYEHPGTIYFADREVNPATGAIRIAGVFANPNNLLRPGGYGRVRASAKTQAGALLVPQRAVIELQGSYQVAVVGSDNKVSIRPVTVGERVGRLWIVTEGLKAGESVIVEGLMKVRDGATVKPVSAESTKAGG